MTKTASRRRSAFSATFDTRSLLLFAVLTLGGGAALHAQQGPKGTASGTMSSDPAEPSSSASALQAPRAASQAAFDRADDNRDGQLSAQEAARLPAIGNRFQELDTDKNGSLSFEEFHEGAKP